MSTAFAPLARVVAEGIGCASLPIITVPHPVGDRDEKKIHRKGLDITSECVAALTQPAEDVAKKFAVANYPLPDALMPR